MNKHITSNFLKQFNLFIKSISLNKSILWNQERRLIIKWLVDLDIILHKEPTDVLISKLYIIKEKLLKEFEKEIKKKSLNKYKHKIKKWIIVTEDTKKDLVFKTITIKEKWNKVTSFHTPKRINITKQKSNKWQPIIVKNKTVKVRDNYIEWDLSKFIKKEKIQDIFTHLK